MQALKMEPVSFDVVISATTAISSMQLRCNTDCCARGQLLGARILCLLCFSSTVTLKLTSILCCFRRHSCLLHLIKVFQRGLSFTWTAALNTQPPHTWEKIAYCPQILTEAHSPEEMQFSIVTCFFGYDIHTSCIQLPV